MTRFVTERIVERDGVRLAAEVEGPDDGVPVVLLHGLTATRRYVVMGSKALERSGHDVVAYDARGHGASAPAPSPAEYEYADLAADLVRVLACSEDPTARDGKRALSLAESLLAAGDTPERESLAAMALAELGRFPDAAARQRRAIEAATGATPAALARLRAQLALYEAGKPCRSLREN